MPSDMQQKAAGLQGHDEVQLPQVPEYLVIQCGVIHNMCTLVEFQHYSMGIE
jgi:hypothetical protein